MIGFTKSRVLGSVGVLVALALVLLIGGWWYIERYYGWGDPGNLCTQDAKLCPDGSSVSRTGPKCEFQACPMYRLRACDPFEKRECTADSRIMCSSDGKEQKNISSNCSCGEDARSLEALGWHGCQDAKIDTSTWKTYRNEQYGFEMKYPSDFVAYAGFRGDDIVKASGSGDFTCFAYDSGLLRQGEVYNVCIHIFNGVSQTPREWLAKDDIESKSIIETRFQNFDAVEATGFENIGSFAKKILFESGNTLYQLTSLSLEEPYLSIMYSFTFRKL